MSPTLLSDSDVWSILRYMNHPPSAVAVSDAIDVLESNLVAIDRQIRSLEAVFDLILENLKRHRDGLRTQIERRSGLLAPVRVLPRDVLIHIFSIANTDNISTPIAESPRYWPPLCSFEAPRALSAVCFWWRDIMMSTPMLWSNVYVSLPINKKRIPHMEAFLERSQNHSLDLAIEVRRGPIEAYLAKYASRIRYLRLTFERTCSVSEAIKGVFGECTGPLPFLEEVVISSTCAKYDLPRDIPDGSLQPFLQAPILQMMDLSLTNLQYTMQMPISLTHYKGFFHLRSDFDLLLHCPNLIHVAFFLNASSPFLMEKADRRIRHCSIQKVYAYLYTILDFLLLPNLEDLEMGQVSRTQEIDRLSAFLQLSQCTLLRLNIYYAAEASGAFFKLSRTVLSSVLDLTVESFSSEETQILIDQLSHTATKAGAFSRLTTLCICIYYGINENEVSLLETIQESRQDALASQWNTATLTSFRLTRSRGE